MVSTYRIVNSRRGSRRQRGFTILELLVVISLIVLLSAMMLPAFARSMRQASKAVCAHNLREIGISLTAYRMDNDGWLPMSPPAPYGTAPAGRDVWFVKLLDSYMPEPMAMTCPDDPFRYRMSKVADPYDDPAVGHYTSYGINGFLMRAGGGFLADLDRNPPKFAGQTILLADLGPDRGGVPEHQQRDAGIAAPFMEGPIRAGGMLTLDDGYDVYSDTQPHPWLTARHGDEINVMTVSGGVVSTDIKDLLLKPVSRHYEECEVGGCTLCRELSVPHYSFAKSGLYWWTGSIPSK